MGFENELLKGPDVTETPLDKLEQKDLEGLYESAVGVNPAYRTFPKEVLIAGIENPAAEKERLALLDQEEDQATRRARN